MDNVLLAEVPGVGRKFFRQESQAFHDRGYHGSDLFPVVCLRGNRGGDDNLSFVVHGTLGIVPLYEFLCGRVLHDPAFGISEVDLIFRLRSVVTLLPRPLLKPFFGLPDLPEPCLSEPEFFGQFVAPYSLAVSPVFLGIDRFGLIEEPFHLLFQLLFPVGHPCVAHGLVLRSVSLYLRPVEGYVAGPDEIRLPA